MSDEPSTSPHTPRDPSRRQHSRRWPLVTMVALAAALTGAAGSRAISQHSWHGPGFGTFDPARFEDGADRAVRHLAIEIDATGDQQEKLRAIVKAAVKDLLPMREKVLSARQRGWVLLTQPALDRAAIEALRTEQIVLADAASKRVAQAIGDAGDVLTTEQRRKLSDRAAEFRERRGFWHNWRRG